MKILAPRGHTGRLSRRGAPGSLTMGAARPPMNDIAEHYVKLVLALGQHDPDYVDSYYGPPSGRRRRSANRQPLSSGATARSTCALAS